MKNKVPIIIGVLTILIGGTLFSLNTGDVITPVQIQEIDFDSGDVQFLNENVEFTFELDDEGVEILDKKTGIKIPVKYNFPILNEETGGYIVEEVNGAIEMNFDAYNSCRQKGETKGECLSQLRADIESNIDAFEINLQRDLEELQKSDFKDEIIIESL